MTDDKEGKQTVDNWIENYNEFKKTYKSIVDVLRESSIKIPFTGFIQISSLIEVTLT